MESDKGQGLKVISTVPCTPGEEPKVEHSEVDVGDAETGWGLSDCMATSKSVFCEHMKPAFDVIVLQQTACLVKIKIQFHN